MEKAAFFFLLAISLALPALAQESNIKGDPARGYTLAQRWCSDCHLLKGENRAVQGIPPFQAIARDPSKTPDYLRAFLVKPHGSMPPLELDRRQIEDIIAYIGSLRAP
ncbi:MAG TPA: cytochrome c [Alphaproteobacteria bacterium]|nr:cytochrome c [Alphaproteobacteria bacterium]